MSVDEAITIASIVEIESGGDVAQMAKISSVIQNRLKAGMQLEMNSTGRYVDSVIKNYIKSDDPETYSKYEEYYNTFKCAGLPAEWKICSPGSEAVKSAISPLDTKLFVFLRRRGRDLPLCGNSGRAPSQSDRRRSCSG